LPPGLRKCLPPGLRKCLTPGFRKCVPPSLPEVLASQPPGSTCLLGLPPPEAPACQPPIQIFPLSGSPPFLSLSLWFLIYPVPLCLPSLDCDPRLLPVAFLIDISLNASPQEIPSALCSMEGTRQGMKTQRMRSPPTVS
uniref:Uncharacterized protein n=1 Tax=Mustela putorius furo TaxID=9669 RepID=M3YK06_MUSPF